jgi:hypothetical protein
MADEGYILSVLSCESSDSETGRLPRQSNTLRGLPEQIRRSLGRAAIPASLPRQCRNSGHELARVRNHDTLTMTITATIAGAISMLAQFNMFFRGGGRGIVGSVLMDLAYNERNIEKVAALARDADQLFIEAPVPRRRRQYRRRKMAFNGAPGGRYRQTSVRRPPHSISLLGSLSGASGRTDARGRGGKRRR